MFKLNRLWSGWTKVDSHTEGGVAPCDQRSSSVPSLRGHQCLNSSWVDVTTQPSETPVKELRSSQPLQGDRPVEDDYAACQTSRWVRVIEKVISLAIALLGALPVLLSLVRRNRE